MIIFERIFIRIFTDQFQYRDEKMRCICTFVLNWKGSDVLIKVVLTYMSQMSRDYAIQNEQPKC